MGQLERLVLLAEDELTQYSTDARKRQKLRQKIGMTVPLSEQHRVKTELLEQLPTHFFGKLVETQRQAIALPFWGIAGLGLPTGHFLSTAPRLLWSSDWRPHCHQLTKMGVAIAGQTTGHSNVRRDGTGL